MFNELSILFYTLLYNCSQKGWGGGGGNTGGYSELRKHKLPTIKSLIFHFSKKYKPTKTEHRNEFTIFRQKKVYNYMASVCIIEVHEIYL